MAKRKAKKQQPKKEKKIVQHLFRVDRVEQKKKEDWKVIGQDIDKRTGVPADIVLMKKNV